MENALSRSPSFASIMFLKVDNSVMIILVVRHSGE